MKIYAHKEICAVAQSQYGRQIDFSLTADENNLAALQSALNSDPDNEIELESGNTFVCDPAGRMTLESDWMHGHGIRNGVGKSPVQAGTTVLARIV